MAANKVDSPEVWRAVNGYEGYYEVSDLGRVRSVPRVITNSLGRECALPGRVLAPNMASNYPSVDLKRDGRGTTRQIHSLVAEAFLPSPPGPIGRQKGCYQVNHIDGVKTNNTASNLEYITLGENHRHAARTGLKARGARIHQAKLTADKVRTIRQRYAAGGVSQAALADEYGVAEESIYRVVNRHTWAHIQ